MECEQCRKGIHHVCTWDGCACCGWLIERGRVGPVALCVVGPCAFFAETGSQFCLRHGPVWIARPAIEQCVRVERISAVKSRRCQNPAASIGNGYCADHMLLFEVTSDGCQHRWKPLPPHIPVGIPAAHISHVQICMCGMQRLDPARIRPLHEQVKLVAFTDEEMGALRAFVSLYKPAPERSKALASAYTKIGGTDE